MGNYSVSDCPNFLTRTFCNTVHFFLNFACFVSPPRSQFPILQSDVFIYFAPGISHLRDVIIHTAGDVVRGESSGPSSAGAVTAH